MPTVANCLGTKRFRKFSNKCSGKILFHDVSLERRKIKKFREIKLRSIRNFIIPNFFREQSYEETRKNTVNLPFFRLTLCRITKVENTKEY